MLFAVLHASIGTHARNAGGPYPLLVRKCRVRPSAWRRGRSALFPIPNTMRPPSTGSGDVVLFASDGILESRDTVQEEVRPGTFDGFYQLFSARSARDISERILAATDATVARHAPHDDRTLVVLRVTTIHPPTFRNSRSSTDCRKGNR